MFTTPEAVRLLKAANPSRPVSEDRVRHALRSGTATAPPRVGRALVWRAEDLVRLAEALGLRAPAIEAPQ